MAAYLSSTGAYDKFPGLRVEVGVDAASDKVLVHVSAPLDLPLTIPGAPETTTVSATGNANVTVDLG